MLEKNRHKEKRYGLVSLKIAGKFATKVQTTNASVKSIYRERKKKNRSVYVAKKIQEREKKSIVKSILYI